MFILMFKSPPWNKVEEKNMIEALMLLFSPYLVNYGQYPKSHANTTVIQFGNSFWRFSVKYILVNLLIPVWSYKLH